MKKQINNSSGISLVEVLATVVILSIVMLAVFSIVSSSVEQNKKQTDEAFQINNSAYVLKQITKDIRKTHHIESGTPNSYSFQTISGNVIVNYVYDPVSDPDNKTLSRNGAVILNNIEDFTMIPDASGQTVTISFKLNEQDYSTTLAFRKGDG